MITYDYHCTSCRHEWRQKQSIKDNPVKTCPECKKRTAERVIGTGLGIRFNGPGFYCTRHLEKI